MVEEECGGVGDFNGKYYMWIIEEDSITAVFDTGEVVLFDNDELGWYEFLLVGMFLGKML